LVRFDPSNPIIAGKFHGIASHNHDELVATTKLTLRKDLRCKSAILLFLPNNGCGAFRI
jgi:hypothetical protein